MKELAEILCALSGLDISLKTIFLFCIIAVIPIVINVIKNNRFDKYYNDMKNEKNKEIERLADDNRRYRDVYLRTLGINQEDIDIASAANVRGD